MCQIHANQCVNLPRMHDCPGGLNLSCIQVEGKKIQTYRIMLGFSLCKHDLDLESSDYRYGVNNMGFIHKGLKMLVLKMLVPAYLLCKPRA